MYTLTVKVDRYTIGMNRPTAGKYIRYDPILSSSYTGICKYMFIQRFI